ncbi:MAG: type II secretion system protein [Limisphaerales bacterium]
MKLRTKKRNGAGFTLLEVMFAVIAFSTATFAILALVSQSLEEARRLQRPMVDASLVAADLSLTNKMVEGGPVDGDLGDLLGDTYHGYSYTYQITEAQSNRLFEVDVVLQNANQAVVSKGSYLFYRPASPAGSLDGATVAR